MECFFLVILSVIFYFAYYFIKTDSKYPPGPRGLPFIGSLLFVGRAPHLKFSEWAKIYGPVFSVKLGGVRAVVLNDVKAIRDAFREDAFSGRPNNKFFQQFGDGKKEGVILTDGHAWTEQRRFALKGLRDFGVGRNSMEQIIMEEVDEFIENLKNEVGQPISVNRKFSLAILNSIWMITCGKRYKHDDPLLSTIFDSGAQVVSDSMKNGYLIFLEALIRWVPEISGWNKFTQAVDTAFNVVREQIHEHDSTFMDTNPPRDFLDTYLTQIKSTTDPNSSFYKDRGYSQLKAVLFDFFSAGSQTTSTTLTWAILYLATHPSVQTKLRDEIHQVVGKNMKPSLADKSRLLYTEAVIQEVLRKSSIFPLGVFHSTMTDVTFQGFEIPKDTYILANLHAVLHDHVLWDEPEAFRPERFLSNDGKTLIKHEAFIPFSTGRRICIGEILARDEIFLFITNLFQRFEITTDRPINEVSLEPELAFLLEAKKFNVVLNDVLL